MARIVGAITTSHVPSIGGAIAKGLQQDPYWKPFFDAFGPVHGWLSQEKPDVAVVIYNDHGLNFFLDAMPTFAVGAAEMYTNADEGWGLPVSRPYKGDTALSWQIIDNVMAEDFDLVTCQEMKVDHAFVVPMQLMWPEGPQSAIPVVPITINSIQHPLPRPERCLKFGQAIGRAIESWGEDKKVLLVATGGLSHQLDGERAGFINKEFDAACMKAMVDDPEWLGRLTIAEIIEKAGSQGVELLCWIALRGALSVSKTAQVSAAHTFYHIPVSNTGGAVMVLDHKPAPLQQAAE